MDLMRQVIDGYPVMDEADYLEKLMIFIEERRALVLRDQGILGRSFCRPNFRLTPTSAHCARKNAGKSVFYC